MSLPAWTNFSIVSGYEWLRKKSFQMRGYGEYMDDKKRIDRTEAKDLEAKGIIYGHKFSGS